MTEDQTMRLVYLGLLGTVIAGTFLIANRHRMGQMAQYAAIWFLIFVGGILVFGVWDDVRRIAMPSQTLLTEDGQAVIEVPRGRDGHYYMTLDINGTPVEFVVDTGATDLVLTQDDARRAGLDPGSLDYVGRAFTANGEVATADVRLDAVTLGGVTDSGVRAVVNGGEMRQSLLGMSYLQEFGRIEIANDRLRLIR